MNAHEGQYDRGRKGKWFIRGLAVVSRRSNFCLTKLSLNSLLPTPTPYFYSPLLLPTPTPTPTPYSYSYSLLPTPTPYSLLLLPTPYSLLFVFIYYFSTTLKPLLYNQNSAYQHYNPPGMHSQQQNNSNCPTHWILMVIHNHQCNTQLKHKD